MYQLIWMNKKGQVKKQLEGGSKAMLQLWVLQNVTSGYAVILDENYKIIKVFECKNKQEAKPISIEEFPFDIISIA